MCPLRDRLEYPIAFIELPTELNIFMWEFNFAVHEMKSK